MRVLVATALAIAVVASMPLGGASAEDPGAVWTLAYGGRLYDSWWEAQGQDAPETRNPAYPADGRMTGTDTWRCVACHGWDYKGRDGEAGGRDPAAVDSLLGLSGRAPKDIAAKIRSAPHAYTAGQIPDGELMILAGFLSEGLKDISVYVDAQGRATGDADRGRAPFEGICASCHQIDGMAYISAEEGDRPSLGWVSRHKPAQALHKIRNGQPGADMVAIRFMEDADIADLFAYIQSLDPAAD